MKNFTKVNEYLGLTVITMRIYGPYSNCLIWASMKNFTKVIQNIQAVEALDLQSSVFLTALKKIIKWHAHLFFVIKIKIIKLRS